MDLKIIEEQINDLRRGNKYQEALQLYKTKIHGKFAVEEIIIFPWIIAHVMYCLRKSDKPQEALQFFLKTMKLIPEKDMHIQILREYGWSLSAMLALNKAETSEEQKINLIKLISDFLNIITIDSEYILFSNLFFEMTNLQLKLKNPPLQEIRKNFQKFRPDQFSEKSRKIKVKIKGKEQETELASDKEKYFMLYSKTLFQTGDYSTCIQCCKDGLRNLQKYHHGNNLWLTRRLALCYSNTGKLNKAIEGFEEISRNKPEWFIQAELSMLYKQKKEYEKALQLACKAAINKGFSIYKVNIFFHMGHIYLALNNYSLACRHLMLSLAIRKEQLWKIPADMKSMIVKYNCMKPDLPAKVQYENLKIEWTQVLKSDNNEKVKMEGTGKITAILHTGSNGDGFITSDNGLGVYFRFPVVQGNLDMIHKGIIVRYIAIKRQHKGKLVWNAIRVLL